MCTSTRFYLFILICVFITACATSRPPVATGEKEPEILYIHVDGTMVFKGRIMNEEDVIIYEDGFGGERAAVKVYIPFKEDIYRDTITVEREEVVVPVERK